MHNINMALYYSSFASGFEKLVEDFITRDISVNKIKSLDGVVIYQTNLSPSGIINIKYLKNSFLVLREWEKVKKLEVMAGDIKDNIGKIKVPLKARTFKVVIMEKNQPINISGQTRGRLVDIISHKTGLRYFTGNADVEFWLLLRDDFSGYFLQKINKSSKDLKQGELEQHIANILCRASEPDEKDVFLDPFTGSGSIPLARAYIGNYCGIFAMDIDENLVNDLKTRIKKIRNSKIQKSFFVKHMDFLKNEFQDNFVNAVVTDPPWGMHQNIDDSFYPKIMNEFLRILKPKGRLVLLTSRDININNDNKLSIVGKYDVLIHGKKATVRVFIKN